MANFSLKRRDIFIFLGGLLLGGAMTCVAIVMVWERAQYALNVVFSEPVKLEVKQAEPQEPAPTDGTMRFDGEEIQHAIQRMARAAGVNVAISDRVQGTVNMDITDSADQTRTPLEAIEIIVEAKGLIMDKGAGEIPTYFIKTPEERAQEPTEADLYTFKNARAADVKKLLVKELRCQVEPQMDERTNTIFYREFRSHVAAIQKFLDFLDQPVGAQLTGERESEAP